jgi:hypothetical protein
MTRSKTELAIILVKLQGEITDPKKIEKEAAKLANEMSLMKLCYEIQKVEETNQSATEEQTVTASAPKESEETPKESEEEPREESEKTPPPEPPVELTEKEEAIVEELKAPEKSTPTQKHKHILSWLLDSSSDDEAAA